MAKAPPRVFISHIHEEAGLGAVIKEWIEDAFAASGVTAFLSSDRRDHPAGQKWLDVLRDELRQTGVMVSLLSPTSSRRQWVNIELGATWSHGLPVIPLCHSGLAFQDLGRPFGDFNGVNLTQADAAERLLEGVAMALGLPAPRKLAFAECLAAMRRAATGAEAHPGAAVAPAAPAAAKGPELADQQVQILQVLARLENLGAGPTDEPTLIAECGIKPAVFKHHVAALLGMNFVHTQVWADSPVHYEISAVGSGWLIDHALMPD